MTVLTSPTLTIEVEGDRKSGVDALTRIAIGDAILGRRVLYATPRSAMTRNIYERVVDQLPADLIARALLCRTNGHQNIRFANGGAIYFVAINTNGHRGIDCDTVILDDAHRYDHVIDSAIVCTAASASPQVYIARWSGDGPT